LLQKGQSLGRRFFVICPAGTGIPVDLGLVDGDPKSQHCVDELALSLIIMQADRAAPAFQESKHF
jgi:hypothetical protein